MTEKSPAKKLTRETVLWFNDVLTDAIKELPRTPNNKPLLDQVALASGIMLGLTKNLDALEMIAAQGGKHARA